MGSMRDAAISQGESAQTSRSQQELGETGFGSASEPPPPGTARAGPPVSDFRLPELGENPFLLPEAPQLMAIFCVCT